MCFFDLLSHSKTSWTVIEFIDSKSVEVVPTKWMTSESQCYWPPMTRDKLMIEIKNGNLPYENWPVYKSPIFKDSTFRKLYATYTFFHSIFLTITSSDEYVTARRKARKAEETRVLNPKNLLSPAHQKQMRRKMTGQ